jgi:hypothetical protein
VSRRNTVRLVAALLALPACAAALADVAPARHCVILAAEYETLGSRVGADMVDAARSNARAVQGRLLQRMQADRLVANTVFVDLGDRAASGDKVRRTRAITGCDTVVEMRNVIWTSAIGGAFGYDVIVNRSNGDAASTLYSRQYRYGLDKATLGRFSFDGFAAAAWDDLREAGVLEADREASPIAPALVKADYDRMAAAWPTNVQEYHLRHIVRETELLASAMIARLHDQNPPDFATLAADSSEDPASAAKGGDVGWLTTFGMPPEIARAVQAQHGSGLIGRPIRANDGWHVIEVLGERASHAPPFEDARDRVAARLRWDAVVPAAAWAEAQKP